MRGLKILGICVAMYFIGVVMGTKISSRKGSSYGYIVFQDTTIETSIIDTLIDYWYRKNDVSSVDTTIQNRRIHIVRAWIYGTNWVKGSVWLNPPKDWDLFKWVLEEHSGGKLLNIQTGKFYNIIKKPISQYEIVLEEIQEGK